MTDNTNDKKLLIPADILQRLEVESEYGCHIENDKCAGEDFETHHINGNQEDNTIENLIFLCSKHLEKVHAGKLDQKLLHEYKRYRMRVIDYFIASKVIEDGKTDELRVLLEEGLNPNGFYMSMGRCSLYMINPITYTTSTGMDTTSCRHPTKDTPLVDAVFNGNLEQVRLLLAHGAKQIWDHREDGILTSEKEPNYRGNLALGLAIKKDYLEITKMLVKSEKSFDEPDQDHGWCTPIHFAISYNRMEHLKVLLEAGADPNKRKKGVANKIINKMKNGSPLYSAINRKNSDAVNLLLKYGADPELEPYYDEFRWRYNFLRSRIPWWKIWQWRKRMPRL
jgi:ankyrin repeat protein